jgi:hypothetical protein
LPRSHSDDGKVRRFASGATRDTAVNKLDHEAFLSPLVILRYDQYMHKNRLRTDGSLRDGDDWQKGIDKEVYIKSAWRHLLDFWLLHRGYSSASGADMEESLCGVLFNVMGYLHVLLESKVRDNSSL